MLLPRRPFPSSRGRIRCHHGGRLLRPYQRLMSSSPVLCAPASEVDEAWQRDPVANLHRFTPDLIRNFSVIAHIDHGKSTLADRLLELTGTIARDKDKPRILDKLKVEKERGITVKAQTASMFYNRDGKTYLLNLIDTPGHVDFSYEVSRSLSACQGTLLLVDASQGVQAQTVANFFLAFSEGLEVVPVLNKVDLPGSDPQRVLHQIATTFELDTSPENVLQISAKTGLGVPSVLAKIVDAIPSPTNLGSATEPFKALLFDTWYDTYVGVVCLVAVHSGTLHRGDRIASSHTDQSYEVTQLGIMHPEQTPTKTLTAGQVGFLHLGMKTTRDALIGDTFYAAAAPPPKPFPGFKPAKSMVFAGAYPIDASEFPKLQDAVDRLTLNDASVSVARETSGALGQGFRLGFLGTLHMDVFRERLEEEHGASVINTAPTVSYQVEFVDERKVGPLEVVTGGRRVRMVKNPAEFPEPDELGNVKEFYEPMVIGTLICPLEYVGGLMELCGSHRGEQLEYTVIDETRVLIKYKLPMSEILIDFYDQLKSRTQGYASFDYEECGYEPADLVKVNLLLNGKAVDALATIVHRSAAAGVAKEWVKRLKGVMDRQLVEIVIQASVGGKIVSRETVSALRKDVTAKLYGGDVTRKMKLLEKQKAGKKRMKAVAGIQLPQEAFLSLIKDDGSGSNKRK